MSSSRRGDVLIILILLFLPLLWFAPQVVGGKTLLPADNLFTFEPWQSLAAQAGVGVPHNPLVSDLILENYAWKSFILDALRSGELAGLLWNPRIFAGVPFLAAGQHSALYPLSAIFYILPLWLAYGVFTWLQLGLAAASMYVFARVLGQGRPAATLAAVAFAFSGFFIVSVNFTMVIAAAAWLPLILAMVELAVRSADRIPRPAGAIGGPVPAGNVLAAATQSPGLRSSPIPYVLAGAVLLGLQILAGHVEITYYVLLVSAFYAAWRLAALWLRTRRWGTVIRLGAWLLAMVALGLALGAVQLMPLYELVKQSFREGSATLQQVRDWAWPGRQLITFLLPDAFGNPTHHAYFDIWARQWVPVTQNALGEPLNTIDWGVKNYVEGGNYLGIPTLLLAVVAVLAALSRFRVRSSGPKATPPNVWPFAVLAVLSLLFAFGTPLYAVLYYGVPGWNQLHSAFRWVFPYTLSMAVLAGYGLDVLGAVGRSRVEGTDTGARLPASGLWPPTVRLLGWLALLAGLGSLAVVVLSLVVRGPFVALGDRLLVASDLARARGFADGAMAWSYEALGLARFGAMAVLAGALLIWTERRRTPADLQTARAYARLYPLPLIALLVLDLWLFGHSFNPAVDRGLLNVRPAVVGWLQEHQDASQPWRLTTFNLPGEKTLNANSAMPFGLEDVRGYDSIIPRQYVAYMDRIQPQAGELLYNRIAPIYCEPQAASRGDGPACSPEPALDSRLLDLLGVRYVVTTQVIANRGYWLAHEGELKVYENLDALPRAFIVPRAVPAADQEAALDLLEQIDPREVVVLEGVRPEEIPPPASPQVREARISKRGNRELFVDVNLSDRGWLVLADSYANGWKAYLRPFGVVGEGVTATGESVEQQLPLYRGDGAFRAVYLSQAGQWTVRFVYSPRSFLLGLYTSFLAFVTLLLLGGWWAWRRFYRGEQSEVGTVAKNTSVRMAMSLMSKAIDFAFAMLRLRVLSPAGEGSYAFAISFYGFFEIITFFGLGTLVTRDVSIDRSRARHYLANAALLRVGLWLLSLPLMGLVCLFYWAVLGKLDAATAQAIALFAGALLFQNISDAISSVFNAFEKMEYPAGIATAIATAKVALGALVLLPPLEWGFVGLAGVSLVMNIVQLIWLWAALRRHIPLAPHPSGSDVTPAAHIGSPLTRASRDWALQRYMLRESGPLMINHLLATVFWRISQWVLYGARNPAALGIFSAGVKWLDGLNVIPAYFTLAIFPLMSRYAQTGKDSLTRAYRLSVQLLYIISLPIAVFFTFASTLMIRILGGAAYLPDSATALAIMIWSIPIGFVNSVTQYVLIAVNQQRFLTRAFLIGVGFTAAANLIFVPRYGYLAAAVIQIPAELSLFIPFYWAVRRHVAPMPWVRMLARPSVAAGLNAGIVWALERAGVPLFAALAAGFAAYVALLLLLGTFRGEDFAVLRGRLPAFRLPAVRRG